MSLGDLRIKTPGAPFDVTLDDQAVDLLCGEKASASNRGLVRNFVYSWISLLSDSPLEPTSRKPRRVFTHFLRRICARPLLETLKTYASLADKLLSLQHLYGSDLLNDQFIEEFRETPVFREYHEFFRTGSPVMFQYVLTFCLFGKKLKYETEAWHQIAFRDWTKVEDGLSTITFDSSDDVVLLRSIVHYLIGNYAPDLPRPRYGGGKVSERGIVGDIAKSISFADLPRLRAVMRRALVDSGLDASFSFRQFPIGDLERTDWGPSQVDSRLKFVPKDISKSRSICMEPNAVMFTQQAVRDWLVKAMATGPMARFVDLTDQTHNQVAALYGSITGDVATVDLSSASDSVSYELVKRTFPKRLLHDLALTRSRNAILPDGRTRRLLKFAPMGSALCFPVQCIVFTSVCILSAMYHSEWDGLIRLRHLSDTKADALISSFVDKTIERTYGYIHPNHRTFQPICVYGDDICIDSSLYDTLTTLLTGLGFKVNASKSFTGSQSVRESCGKFYLAGYDVTPTRFTLPARLGVYDAPFLASCIALINRANSEGLTHLRRYLLGTVMYDGNRKLPWLFTDREDLPYGIVSYGEIKNDHLRRVGFLDEQPKGAHNRDYCRSEVKCYTFKYAEAEESYLSDYEAYRYLRWWATSDEEEILEPIIGSSRHRVTAGSRVTQSWTPA